MKTTRSTAERWDKRRTQVVRAPAPPPPPKPVEQWALLSETEAARLREFREFLSRVAPTGYFAMSYFDTSEELELENLESKLIGGAVQLPKPWHGTWGSLGEVGPIWRRHRRDRWWKRHESKLATVERRNLPVWRELNPGPDEPVSVASAADYDWLGPAIVDDRLIEHIKKTMAWERKMGGHDDDDAMTAHDRPMAATSGAQPAIKPGGAQRETETAAADDADDTPDRRAEVKEAENAASASRSRDAEAERRMADFLQGDDGWHTLMEF